MKWVVMGVLAVLVLGCAHERSYSLGGKPAANFVEYMEANNMAFPPMPESLAKADQGQRMCLRKWFYARLSREAKVELDAASVDVNRKLSSYTTTDLNFQTSQVLLHKDIMERGAKECGL